MTLILGNILQFDWLAMPDSGWLWHTLAFIAIWTVGLFVVQAKTLVSPQYNTRRFRHWAPRIRLLIDLCFTTAITMLVPPIGLVIISVAAFFADVGLIAHYQYFRRPLSALTLYHNWREGANATRHALSAQSKRLILICGAALLIKVALIIHAPDPGVRKTLWLVGLAAIAAYFGLMTLASSIDPLNGILTTRGVGRVGIIRGYLFTWLAEFVYLGKRQVLEDAIRQRQIASDVLTPVEATIPIRDQLVIVQVESLDFNVYGSMRDGQEVTPFLNRLREQSMFYRIAAARYIGTADADFIMLNGVMPSSHITTYNIPGYPYQNTLPQYLAQFGYRTSLFHGNTGNFYNRRAAFERMGFAELHFEEELKEQDRLPKSAWGIEDKEVLGYSSRMLHESNGRVCHFIITLTTHTPYTLLDSEREVVGSPQSIAQNYLNNMRYLDNQFRKYIGALTSATVVIYSDHPADPAVAPEFISDYRGDRAFVPCLIYDTESDLGAIQRTRAHPLATDGSLTLLDISNYLRKQVALSHGQAPLATSQSGGWPSLSTK